MQDSPSLEMQRKLLGAYIENPNLFEKVENLVRPGIFTSAVARKSYEIIKDYHSKDVKPDISIIFRNLIKVGIPQSECVFVTTLGEHIYLPENKVTEYVEALFGDYTATYLSNAFANALSSFKSSDPIVEMLKVKDAITTVELALNNVSKDKSILAVFDETEKIISDLKNGIVESGGFSWGIKELDKKSGGICPGVSVVAAVPGAGKTSLVINAIIANAIDKGLPTLLFSLEMKDSDIMINIISHVKEINSRALRQGDIDDDQMLSIQQVRKRLKDNFTIDDTDGITWQQVETKIKAFKKKHKISSGTSILVMIDYIQKMRNTPDEMRSLSKEERMETICNELARVAKHENVSLVEVSQFSRETGKRDVPRPKMSDLKGSAAIEQNAILILLMYRPDYQSGQTVGAKGLNLIGLCEINIAKGRFVHPEPVYAKFEGKYSRFIDYKEEEDGITTSGEVSF
jgi:replicative DNA helicase